MSAAVHHEELLTLPDDPTALAKELARRGIGDGLPVVPATPERVERMLVGVPGDPDRILGYLEQAQGRVTPRDVAINAVLAGCEPDHMPVLIAATLALLRPAFNLYAIQPTTNPIGPLVMVHGPIRERLQMNSGIGCFGPGNFANATIGRAVRLILQNIGGAVAGVTDFATHGWPGKYTFCAAENSEETPWRAFHERRGVEPGRSAVSLFGVYSSHNIVDLASQDGFDTLNLIGRAMGAAGTNNHVSSNEALVVLAPEHAQRIYASGLDYDDAVRILFEHARIDMTGMPTELRNVVARRRPGWVDLARVPAVDSLDDIHLVVTGGPGVHAQYLPSAVLSRSVTEVIEE